MEGGRLLLLKMLLLLPLLSTPSGPSLEFLAGFLATALPGTRRSNPPTGTGVRLPHLMQTLRRTAHRVLSCTSWQSWTVG